MPFAFATGYGGGGLKDTYSGQPSLQEPFNTEALDQAIRHALGHRG